MNYETDPAPHKQECIEPFKMLCIIAPWKMKKELPAVLSAHGCLMLRIIHGEGSYRPYHNLLDFVPISSSERVVIFAMCKALNLFNVYDRLNDQFSFDKRDTGIAFSLNVNEIVKQDKGKQAVLQNGAARKDKTDMKLLIIIVNDGFSGDILNLLDNAGAGGATIMPARGWGGSGTVLGVPIEPAKEIVMSVVSAEVCAAVTEMIGREDSLPKAANGIAVSLDVASVNHINKFVRKE